MISKNNSAVFRRTILAVWFFASSVNPLHAIDPVTVTWFAMNVMKSMAACAVTDKVSDILTSHNVQAPATWINNRRLKEIQLERWEGNDEFRYDGIKVALARQVWQKYVALDRRKELKKITTQEYIVLRKDLYAFTVRK